MAAGGAVAYRGGPHQFAPVYDRDPRAPPGAPLGEQYYVQSGAPLQEGFHRASFHNGGGFNAPSSLSSPSSPKERSPPAGGGTPPPPSSLHRHPINPDEVVLVDADAPYYPQTSAAAGGGAPSSAQHSRSPSQSGQGAEPSPPNITPRSTAGVLVEPGMISPGRADLPPADEDISEKRSSAADPVGDSVS